MGRGRAHSGPVEAPVITACSRVAALAFALHNPSAMSRRALCLLALLAPLAAGAQDVTFVDDGPFTVAECQGDPAMPVTWTVTTTTAIELGSEYRIVVLRGTETCASLTNPVDTPADSQVIAKDLAAHIGNNGKTPSATFPGYAGTTGDLRLSDLLDAGNQTCDGTANLTVTVCVQLNKADGAYVTSAVGTISIEREKPDQPQTVTVSPGDGALVVGWAAGSGSNTATSRYRAEAYACASATDTTCGSTIAASAETGNETSRSLRLAGLTVGTRYRVVVYALSVNGTLSVASDAKFGVPINAFDYWELYTDMNGQEQGGCAGGPAGLLSLLALAGLLGALRRRP